jgi:nucleotide-binding universal stress UspA family protein
VPRHARIETLVKPGAPAKEIGASAARVKAELIVMGRGGRRTLREEFLGSTAERVIRQSRLPVLVVRLTPRAAYRRPALALDTDRAAHEVVRLMLLVLPSPRPRVAVIHAFGVPYRSLISSSLSDDEVSEMEISYQREATQDLTKLLHASIAKANLRPEDVPSWDTRVRYGSPRVVVEKFTRKAETDLLMLGTRGYSGVAQAFLGTVAGDLLRKAKCDVLVVPPRSSRR